MNATAIPALPSVSEGSGTLENPTANEWPLLPTETEIYILADGSVVIADLPAELAGLVQGLGVTEPCAILHDDLP